MSDTTRTGASLIAASHMLPVGQSVKAISCVAGRRSVEARGA